MHRLHLREALWCPSGPKSRGKSAEIREFRIEMAANPSKVGGGAADEGQALQFSALPLYLCFRSTDWPRAKRAARRILDPTYNLKGLDLIRALDGSGRAEASTTTASPPSPSCCSTPRTTGAS